jgi:hypothetical protein
MLIPRNLTRFSRNPKHASKRVRFPLSALQPPTRFGERFPSLSELVTPKVTLPAGNGRAVALGAFFSFPLQGSNLARLTPYLTCGGR